MTIEDILKTEYKGVKALTPGKEQDVIKFLAEIAQGRKNLAGENISWRENDPEYYGTYLDRKLVYDKKEIPATREIYTGLIYSLSNMSRD